jgi:hypothetical protein
LFGGSRPTAAAENTPFQQLIQAFRWNGRATEISSIEIATGDGLSSCLHAYTNEFWTSRQRAAHSLHEVSYRACFKPQLPRFFIERLTAPGEIVYDPFSGRGTTALEAALLDRVPFACDVSPLSAVLLQPRLSPPETREVVRRLSEIDLEKDGDCPGELLVFYHPQTLAQICRLKDYLTERENAGGLDVVDAWIRMVAVNRLTGHSSGFFSVYTLPPNQAPSVRSQKRINARRSQQPPLRDIRTLIITKTEALLADCGRETRRRLAGVAFKKRLLSRSCDSTPEIEDHAVALVVTSPPFLDVVNYESDNWLRCWFCGIAPESVPLTVLKNVDDWQRAMRAVFSELGRVLRPGGHVAFEVGEVRGGRLRLEEVVIPAAIEAGLRPACVLINAQQFTKTANIWGVSNNRRGTNTNRIVILQAG